MSPGGHQMNSRMVHHGRHFYNATRGKSEFSLQNKLQNRLRKVAFQSDSTLLALSNRTEFLELP